MGSQDPTRQGVEAVASTGDSWMCFVRNDLGTAQFGQHCPERRFVTLDPNGLADVLEWQRTGGEAEGCECVGVEHCVEFTSSVMLHGHIGR